MKGGGIPRRGLAPYERPLYWAGSGVYSFARIHGQPPYRRWSHPWAIEPGLIGLRSVGLSARGNTASGKCAAVRVFDSFSQRTHRLSAWSNEHPGFEGHRTP
jgi:hypothetical protein